jgi:hypothetical protein
MSSSHLKVWGVALGWMLAALISACGGVDGGGTGSPTVGYSQGPITGFGSIIVNGTHFDETLATVVNDNGTPLTTADLKLGMTVEIDGSGVDRSTAIPTATATQVRVRSDLLGAVSASDTVAGTLTVVGQTVQVTASTVFDDRLAGGQAALKVGDLVEVYAIYDPVGNVYAARRIEPVSMASHFKVRGQAHALDPAARTFQIGTATFVYSVAPAALKDGSLIKVLVATARDNAGRWQVSTVDDDTRQISEGAQVEVEGVISAFTSQADFVLSGRNVNASGAAVTPAGSVLAAGVRIEVQGVLSAGVLVVSKLQVKSTEDGGSSDGGGQGVEYEIKSTILSLDTANQAFVVKAGSQRIDYSAAKFSGAPVANLKVGARVEVHGRLSADGTVVKATEVNLD